MHQSEQHPPTRPVGLRRRGVLLGAGAGLPAGLWPGLAAFAQSPPPPALRAMTVLYQRDSDALPARADIAPLAAATQIEQGFVRAGMNVRRPSASALEQLDQSPDMVVTLDPEAGACLIFSASQARLPQSQDRTVHEVRLQGRVFLGPSVLAAGSDVAGTGRRMTFQASPEAERVALEGAASQAADELTRKVLARLRALKPEEVDALQRPIPTLVTGGQVVARPRPQLSNAASAGSGTPVGGTEAPLPPPRRRHALVVGVSDYRGVNRLNGGRMPLDNLPGVATDVGNLRKLLLRRGFAPDAVVVLENDQATSVNVRGRLEELARRAEPDDLVVVAFSAHGAPARYTPSGYGMPLLADFRLPEAREQFTGALDFWQVQALINGLPARQLVLVVDTCHSGGVAMRMPQLRIDASGASVRSGPVVPKPERLAADIADTSKHYAVIAASQPDELSLEDASGGGLFTSQLVRAIGDADGRRPLAQVFREQVLGQVVESSQTSCRRRSDCKVQTPVFAYAGRGGEIRL